TREELLIVFGIIIGMLFFASGVIYHFEYQAQPEKFSSIFASMWWAVSTMTTVGYGDIYPVTVLGKIFGGFVSILGLGTFGLPMGIIAYGFIETLQKQKSRPVTCPHCGEMIDSPIERRQKRH
ncbi:MAG: potassium channel family protein, partial [Bacteroidales bacterium]|nr:potassium channel family protein [Bacteroidales bacterium]